MTSRETEPDAIVCYLLSKRQGAAMIAVLMNKTEEEVNSLIATGERLLQDRSDDE